MKGGNVVWARSEDARPWAAQLVGLRVALLAALGAVACASSDKDGKRTEVSGSARATVGSGYERNDLGVVVRHGPPKCDPKLTAAKCQGTETKLDCKADGDCTDRRWGSCTSREARMAGTSDAPIDSSCGCSYGCSEDSDCAPGSVCVCGDMLASGISQCVRAWCSSSADCKGEPCALSDYHDGCGRNTVVTCKTKTDTCQSNADCGKDKRGEKSFCASGSDGRDSKQSSWNCRSAGCMVGRPLTIAGQTHAASAIPRDDWFSSASAPSSLDATLRKRIAGHWLTIAGMEHASVASFARFTLQLMAVGAPPTLLFDAQRSGLDEIEHAKIAYGIAAAYGASTLGPASLPAAIAPVETTVEAIVHALVIEGCVGETCGAMEASVLAARADERPLADALRVIAADEQRHAALAWRTLRWLALEYGSVASLAARSALDIARYKLDASTIPAPSPDDDVVSRHGVLPEEEALALHRDVLNLIVAPLLEETFSGPPVEQPDANG